MRPYKLYSENKWFLWEYSLLPGIDQTNWGDSNVVQGRVHRNCKCHDFQGREYRARAWPNKSYSENAFFLWRIFSSKLLRQLILKEPQFFYFFLYGVYVQDDIKMYNYEVINSTLGSFNFFNKRELVQEMHEVPKGIEYDVRHRNRHVTVLNQSDNALYDITTVRHKNTFSVSNIFY